MLYQKHSLSGIFLGFFGWIFVNQMGFYDSQTYLLWKECSLGM